MGLSISALEIESVCIVGIFRCNNVQQQILFFFLPFQSIQTTHSGDWSRQNAAEYARRTLINKIWGITYPSYWKALEIGRGAGCTYFDS